MSTDDTIVGTARKAKHSIAGDVDYGVHGEGYARQRRADPRIARHIHEALGDARTVLNIGAGAGSYEPADRDVVAVEPSAAMRAQRGSRAAPAIDAVAESLPFDDDTFDASMATITVHQWRDLAKGLREMRRVTRGPVVIMAFEPDAYASYWLMQMIPELMDVIRSRDPAITTITGHLGGRSDVQSIPIPIDCSDGFVDSFYARPESFLDPAVRRSQSSWNFVADEPKERFVVELARDLGSGEWDRKFGELRTKPCLDVALRMIVNMG
jgi:SAM-dependent methyltransferase